MGVSIHATRSSGAGESGIVEPSDADVDQFIADLTPASRRDSATKLCSLLRVITGAQPRMWGTIIGFGSCHYTYPTGTQGDSPIIGFAPRKGQTTVYLLDGVDSHAEALSALGPHSTGKGCLYLKNVDLVNRTVLTGIITESIRKVTDDDVPGVRLTVTDPL